MTAGDAIGRTSVGNGGSRRDLGNSLQDDGGTRCKPSRQVRQAWRTTSPWSKAVAVPALTRVRASAIVDGIPRLRKRNSDFSAMLPAAPPERCSCSERATAGRSSAGTRSPFGAGVGNVGERSAGLGKISDACLDRSTYSSLASGSGKEPSGFGSICSMSSQPLASSHPYRNAFNSPAEANS